LPNPENLKPFPKGKSGNPKGRPRKLPDLRELLDKVCGEDEIEKVIAAQIKKAQQGDSRAAELVLSYSYGKPKQQIEHTGKDDGAIEVREWIVEIPIIQQPDHDDSPKSDK